MALSGLVGYSLLGIGPVLAFLVPFIARKSFLVLLTFSSAFFWLLVHFLTAAIFRGFEPFDPTASSYAGVLVTSVVLQELARLLVLRLHRIVIGSLSEHALSSGTRLEALDHLDLAISWGAGHAVIFILFFFASFLPLTIGDGTWYQETCPAMSMFLVMALLSLAASMLLISIMVVALEGSRLKPIPRVLFAPVMHLAAAFMGLGNLSHNGCLWSLPLLLVFGASNMAFAAKVCWDKACLPENAAGELDASANLLSGTSGVAGVQPSDEGSEAETWGPESARMAPSSRQHTRV